MSTQLLKLRRELSNLAFCQPDELHTIVFSVTAFAAVLRELRDSKFHGEFCKQHENEIINSNRVTIFNTLCYVSSSQPEPFRIVTR